MRIGKWITICWLLMLLVLATRGQGRWIEGEVRLPEDSTFVGIFKIDAHVDKQIILIKVNNRLIAVPPRGVVSAEGIVNGQYTKWVKETFQSESSAFEVSLMLEEVYSGGEYTLYKKDLSFIKWSPYADILCDAMAYDSYKHLINNDALLLKHTDQEKMLVINRPHTWNSSKFMVNKKLLADYLEMDKQKLKSIIKGNHLKLEKLEDIVSLFSIMDERKTHQLTYSGE